MPGKHSFEMDPLSTDDIQQGYISLWHHIGDGTDQAQPIWQHKHDSSSDDKHSKVQSGFASMGGYKGREEEGNTKGRQTQIRGHKKRCMEREVITGIQEV